MPLINNINCVNNQFTFSVNEINASRCVFYCNNLYTDASLTLQLNNINSLAKTDVVIMHFIFNSVHSKTNNYIRYVKNETNEPLLSLWNNLDPLLETSHYVKQKIKIMFNISRNQFVALNQIERFDELHEVWTEDSSIIDIQDTSDNVIYKPNDVISQITTSMDGSIANKMNVNWQMENMISNDEDAFDRYILNIYDEAGILEDTSGNENDDVHKYTTTNASFIDCLSSLNYTTKVYKVYAKQSPFNNNNAYQFFLSTKQYRIKSIQLKQSKVGTLAAIAQIQYKELLSNANYSSLILSNDVYLMQTQVINNVTVTTYLLNVPTIMIDTIITLTNSLVDTISMTCDVYDE